MKIIKKPLITEKTLHNYKVSNKVTFEVNMSANKLSASKAVETLFNVKIINAQVSNRLGKYKYSRFSKRISKLNDKKIIVFTLDTKSKIDLFETK